MRMLLVAVLGTLFVAAAGCQSDDKHHGDTKHGDTMKMSGDACQHCPGVQKATAEGKCPLCGKVSSASMSTSGGASADACSTCAGVQTASADGKCSACGMEVANK